MGPISLTPERTMNVFGNNRYLTKASNVAHGS